MHNNISKNDNYFDPHLGIDFGGVIIPTVKKKGDGVTQFSDNFLHSPPQYNALVRIQSLVKAFNSKVWIISKAGKRTEYLTRIWMTGNNFFSHTGIPEKNLFFCRERIEKRPLCKRLKITHFIDDRIHIMQILKGIVPYLFLFGDKEQNRSARKWTVWTVLVEDWNEAYDAVLTSIEDFQRKYW